MAEKPVQLSKFSGLLLSNVVFTDTVLGTGSDAIVYVVKWNGNSCAAKRLHEILLEDASPGGADRLISNFEEECLTWSKLRHPAVVQFLGVYFEPRSRLPVLVLEKMDISLRRFLEDHTKEEFSLQLKVFVLLQVAQALAYLHAQKPLLVHHDLSPNNVLLNKVSFVTKVTDFGMSRVVHPSTLTRKSSIKGTLAFMAPEALQDPPRYNETLDIFSFGNIILSTLTHEWPTPSPPTYLKGNKVVGRSELQRREQYCEMLIANEKKLFSPIVRRCLQNAPDKRPSSAVLLGELQYFEALIPKSSPTSTPAVQPSAAEGKEHKVKENTQGTGLVELFRGVAAKWRGPQIAKPKASPEDLQTTTRVIECVKVVVAGGGGVGKSQLISRFINNVFKVVSDPTIEEVFSINIEVDSKVIEAQIWDTAGTEEFRPMVRYRLCMAYDALLVYDITSYCSYEDAKMRWLCDMRDHTNSDIVIMLVGNKCDLEHRRAVPTEEAKAYAEENSMLFMETSAKDGTNVEAAFHTLLTGDQQCAYHYQY